MFIEAEKLSNVTSHKLIETARSFIGRTAWQHQGRYVSSNLCVLDCAGFVVAVLSACGIVSQDKDSYTRYPTDNNELQKVIELQCDRTSQLQHGCLLLLKIRKLPQHLAWYSCDGDYPTLIHSVEDKGAEEVIFDRRWRDRTVAAYLIRGIYYRPSVSK